MNVPWLSGFLCQSCSSAVCSSSALTWSTTLEFSLTVNWPWPAISWKSSLSAGIISDGSNGSVVTLIAMWWLDWCYHSLALTIITLYSPAYGRRRCKQEQNVAAWLVLVLDRRAHVTPALKRLHWLPVKYRILFKLATLMHYCLHHCCPAYLMDIVTFNDSDTAVHRLQSLTTRAAIMKQTRTQVGQRAFSVAGPDVWNSLPPEVRLTKNFATFKKKLKTHLFDIAFS